jgi:MFS family permease
MSDAPVDTAPGAGDSNGEAPLSAAAALALLRNQQLSVNNQRGRFVSLISLGWGVAWLLGFLALWLIDGLRPAFGLPLPTAVSIFVVLIVAGIVLSIVQSVRSGRGFRGSASAFTGTVYGVSWSVAMAAIGVLGGALQYNGMSPELANFFYPCAYTFAAGLLYLIAGGIWHSVPSVVVGGWIVLVAVVAPWFGYPTHYLVFAIAGGGAFLVLAIWEANHSRNLRRTVGVAAAAGAAHHG